MKRIRDCLKSACADVAFELDCATDVMAKYAPIIGLLLAPFGAAAGAYLVIWISRLLRIT